MEVRNYKFYIRDRFDFYFWRPKKDESSYWYIFHWQLALGFVGAYRFLSDKELKKRTEDL